MSSRRQSSRTSSRSPNRRASSSPNKSSSSTPPISQIVVANRKIMTYHDRYMAQKERWSEARFQDMVKIWNLNDIERNKMRQLQFRVEDVSHWKNDPYELVRFLKEFKSDVDMAEHVFRYCVDWRKEKNMETHMERYGTPDPRFHHFPVGILEGTDKEGDPIYCYRFGSADSWGLLEEFGADGVIDYILFFYEYVSRREFWRNYEEEAGRRITNLTAVIDLEGLDERYVTRPGLLPLLERMARITQDCYAGWGKRIFLLRAPPSFKRFWSMAKYSFDPSTQDKMIFADHAAAINEYIDPRVLPPCVAPGIGQGRSMPGYFENVYWEAGPIPTRKEAKKQLKLRKSKSLQYVARQPVASVTTISVLKGFWDRDSGSTSSGGSGSNNNEKPTNISARRTFALAKLTSL